MKKEQLANIGLTEDQISQVFALHGKRKTLSFPQKDTALMLSGLWHRGSLLHS